jgi:ubiquinone/menaquinone biosynthesis C-methylase UbiE
VSMDSEPSKMDSIRISYDTIAADYAIHRTVHPALLRRLIEYCGALSSARVLEVGCGTGNYASSLASATRAKCSGLDPSPKMLDVARQKAAPVSWFQGSAESLPFPDGSFDFVYSVDVIHHVENRTAFFREAFRVLAAGGLFVTATDTEETIRQRAVSHYFPEAVEPELRRYPKPGEIPQLLLSSGIQELGDEMVESAYDLSDSAPFERKTHSCLHLISDDAFDRGLARLKNALRSGPIRCVSSYVIYRGRKSITS